ncbi:hypothetical protein WKI65_43540 [Streptomyces sp. MS1.AVA.3]|uniref:hypothetical protein n=1 Tax=Streptomyces decoyicus TaxID=249567 RepID=UPI0030BEA093
MSDFIDLNAVPVTRHPQDNPLSIAESWRGLAYHEAAHALTGIAAGMQLESLQLLEVDAGQGLLGLTGSTTWAPTRAAEFDFAVECAAGAVASRRQLEEAGLATEQVLKCIESLHDREVAVKVLAQCGFQIVISGPAPDRGATWREVTQAAERAVDELWSDITAVAEALLASPGHRLTAEMVSAITGRPNPTTSAASPGPFPSRWRIS